MAQQPGQYMHTTGAQPDGYHGGGVTYPYPQGLQQQFAPGQPQQQQYGTPQQQQQQQYMMQQQQQQFLMQQQMQMRMQQQFLMQQPQGPQMGAAGGPPFGLQQPPTGMHLSQNPAAQMRQQGPHQWPQPEPQAAAFQDLLGPGKPQGIRNYGGGGGTAAVTAGDNADDGFTDFAAAPAAGGASPAAKAAPHGVDRNAPLDMGLFGEPEGSHQMCPSPKAASALAAAGITTMETQERIYEKGDRVMYRQRDGTDARAVVVAIDRSIHPYSYGIRIEASGNERETEGNRLRPVGPADAQAPAAIPAAAAATPSWLSPSHSEHNNNNNPPGFSAAAPVAPYVSGDFGDFAGAEAVSGPPLVPAASDEFGSFTAAPGPALPHGPSPLAGTFADFGSFDSPPAPAAEPVSRPGDETSRRQGGQVPEDLFGPPGAPSLGVDFGSFESAGAPNTTATHKEGALVADLFSEPPLSASATADFGSFASAAPAEGHQEPGVAKQQGGALAEDLFSAPAPSSSDADFGSFASAAPDEGVAGSVGAQQEQGGALAEDLFSMPSAAADSDFGSFTAAAPAAVQAPQKDMLGMGGIPPPPVSAKGTSMASPVTNSSLGVTKCDDGGNDDFGGFGDFTGPSGAASAEVPGSMAVSASAGPREGPLDLSLFGDGDVALENASISLDKPPPQLLPTTAAAAVTATTSPTSAGPPEGVLSAISNQAAGAAGAPGCAPHQERKLSLSGIGEDAWDSWADASTGVSAEAPAADLPAGTDEAWAASDWGEPAAAALPPPGVAVAPGDDNSLQNAGHPTETEDLFAAQAAEEMFAAEAAANADAHVAAGASASSESFAAFGPPVDSVEDRPADDDMFQAFSEVPMPSYVDNDNYNSFAAFASAEQRPAASLDLSGTADASFADSSMPPEAAAPELPTENDWAENAFAAFPSDVASSKDSPDAADECPPGVTWTGSGGAALPEESDWAADADSSPGFVAFIKSENLRPASSPGSNVDSRKDGSTSSDSCRPTAADHGAAAPTNNLDGVRGQLSFEPSKKGKSGLQDAIKADVWCALLEAARRVLQEADDWFQAVHEGGLEDEVAQSPQATHYAVQLARVALVWKAVSFVSEYSHPLPSGLAETCERLSGLCEEAWGQQREQIRQAEEHHGSPEVPGGSLGSLVLRCCAEDETALAMASWEPSEKLRKKMRDNTDPSGFCALCALPICAFDGSMMPELTVSTVPWGQHGRRCLAPMAALWRKRVSDKTVDVLEN